MGQGADRVRDADYEDVLSDVDAPGNDTRNDVEQTRAEMSETIDAIQERLAPERLSAEAKDVATEVSAEARLIVDEAVDKVKEAFPELTGQAEQMARDVIDHALQEAKGSLPLLSEQTQETIDHIVDHAIQEAKTALRELGAEARASVRDATIGRVERMADTTTQTGKSFSSSLVTTIKQNPGPAALTALGIGWLVMSGSGKTQGTSGAGVQQKASDLQGTASGLASQAQEQVTNTTDDVLHTASGAADQVQQAAAGVASQAQETATAAVGQVQETAGQVTSQAQLLPTRIALMASENPVPVGLVAMALGGAAALLMPETQREQQIMGSTRDKLVDQAQAKAADVVEKVKTVAEEASEAVEKEAKYQGLTTDEG